MEQLMRINQIARFALGRVLATPGALHAMEQVGMGALPLLARHQSGDWGQVDAEDWQANDEAVERGWRIVSAYDIGGSRVWIITEAAPGILPPAALPHPCGASDRSSTTLLLPEEY